MIDVRFLKKLFKQTGKCFLSLLVDISGLIAGIFFASVISGIEKKFWIISIYPALLSIRGVIGGIFSGKLSTSLHLGTVYPSFRKNSEDFYQLIASIATLIFIGSIYLSFTSIIYNLLMGRKFNILALYNMVSINMITSFIIISPITIIVAFLSYRSGLLDPDYILYPVMSTISDIFLTLIYINSIRFIDILTPISTFIEITFGSTILLLFIKYREEDTYIEILKQALLTLLIVSIIVGIAGQILSKILIIIRDRLEIVLIYPALIDTVGDAGSIIGSIATTRLALGTLSDKFKDIKNMAVEITSSLLALIVMSSIYSVISYIYLKLSLNSLLNLAVITITGILTAGITMITLSYIIAITAFKFKLDPDNFVNPIESSIADTVTTGFLALSIILCT